MKSTPYDLCCLFLTTYVKEKGVSGHLMMDASYFSLVLLLMKLENLSTVRRAADMSMISRNIIE